MKKYVNQIISYLDYLTDQFGWQITIHDFHYITGRYASAFSRYHIHNNPFCIQLKNTREVWDCCIARQRSLLDKLDKPIQFGMCHCGVEEYVLPITYKSKNIGFVSISGYRQNTELAVQKFTHAADKYQLNLPLIHDLYEKGLNPQVPDQDIVYTLAAPIIAMLEYLFLLQLDLFGETDIRKHDDSSTFTKALLYLERYYREHITLQDLCEFCSCSCSYMSHLFKQQTGRNMNQYINDLRIAEARILLSNTGLSITEIALNVGYSSSNYFTNVFRDLCQCTPSEYRRLHRTVKK